MAAIRVVRAAAAACGARDLFVVVLEALQTQLRALARYQEEGGDEGEDAEPGGRRGCGWRLAGALAAALAHIAPRLRRPGRLLPDAMPLVYYLAAAAAANANADAGADADAGDDTRASTADAPPPSEDQEAAATSCGVDAREASWGTAEDAMGGVWRFAAAAANVLDTLEDDEAARLRRPLRAFFLVGTPQPALIGHDKG